MKPKTSIASQERMTDAQVAEVKRLVANLLEREGYSKEQGQRIIRRAGELSICLAELFDRLAQGWLDEILDRERKAHRDFFGQRFSLKSFRETLEKYGSEKISEWQRLGLEPHFLPEIAMPRDAAFPGWKVKPEDWYYNEVAAGKILRQQPGGSLIPEKEVKLEGITVLVDTRLKPPFNNGKQMFENDNLLGPIIERLRKEGKIARYDYDKSSRFGVSADEWEEHIKPEIAKLLGLKVSQVRLERAIEGNIIPQLYPDMPRHKDGKTNVWVWYEEYLGDRGSRLFGGFSSYGGLAYVDYYYSSDFRWDRRGFRPLAVL